MVLPHPAVHCRAKTMQFTKINWHAELQNNSVRMFSTPGLIRDQNRGAFPLWLSSFGHMRTQKLHSDVEQNNPAETEEAFSVQFCLNPRAFCLQWEHNSQDHLSIWTVVALHLDVQPPSRGTVRQSVRGPPRSTVPHDFMNVTAFALSQHLGNVFICQNVDEAFHLLAVPS